MKNGKKKFSLVEVGIMLIMAVLATLLAVALASTVQGCGADNSQEYDLYYQPCHDACEAANEAATRCGLDPVPREVCLPALCDSGCRPWHCRAMLPLPESCDELRARGWPHLELGNCEVWE